MASGIFGVFGLRLGALPNRPTEHDNMRDHVRERDGEVEVDGVPVRDLAVVVPLNQTMSTSTAPPAAIAVAARAIAPAAEAGVDAEIDSQDDSSSDLLFMTMLRDLNIPARFLEERRCIAGGT